MNAQNIQITTNNKIDIIDITDKIFTFSANINTGALLVFVKHTTAGLIINEYEENLVGDFKEFYDKLAKGNWKHDLIDNNAKSHLMSTLLNPSLLIPIKNGKPVLGTWQRVLFVELDGPRRREVYMMEIY